MRIPRHKTAIRRTENSRPIKVAMSESLISEETTVFDYGCGHGTDVRLLKARNITASGWDPVHFPSGKKASAQVVNLGYVLNVIEKPDERSHVLQNAWSLAERLLIVSGRLDIDARRQKEGARYSDGCITELGTFQKFFEQQELQELIDTTLETESVAAAPGIFLVFRDPSERESFIASRFRRRASQPRLRRSDVLFEEHRDDLEPLMQFVSDRGRLPELDELSNSPALLVHFGSLKRAFALVRRVTGPEAWEELKELRRQDLLVFLALAAFPKRPKFSWFSLGIQRDIRALFGSYTKAQAAADKLLFSAGDSTALRYAALKSEVGKKMPEAIYVHVDARDSLPPVLRVYEGCARVLLGNVLDATLVKLRLTQPSVSYLVYDAFDRDPHPALRSATNVDFTTRRVRRRDYEDSANPPVLHRKEEFVPKDYPGREKFARLTRQEESRGLYVNPSGIGTRDGWSAVVERSGFELRGHRLVRQKNAN